MVRSAILTAFFALGCVPPESPPRTEPRASTPSVSATAGNTTTEVATASANVPTPAPPPDGLGLGEDGPLPSAWGCPPIEAPIERVVETTATVLGSHGTDLFWADGEGVWMKPLVGEAVKLARGAPQLPPRQLLVTEDEVLLLSSREAGNTCAAAVRTIPRSSPDASAAKTLMSGRCVKQIAASKQHVAFHVATYHPGEDWTSGNAYLLDRSKSGQPTKLDFELPEDGALALTGSKLLATFSGGRVYAARLESPGRFELLTQTSAVRLSFSSQDPRIFAVDGEFAYFYSSGGSNTAIRVLRVALDGAAPEVLGMFPRETARPPGQGFVSSERYLYFSVPQEGAVYRVDKQGKCGIERVAEGRKSATGLTFVNGAIHWSDASKPPGIYRRRE